MINTTKLCASLTLIFSLYGCASQANIAEIMDQHVEHTLQQSRSSITINSFENNLINHINEGFYSINPPESIEQNNALDTVWMQMSENFHLHEQTQNTRVDAALQSFIAQHEYMETMSERAAPFIHFIYSEVAKRNMPAEIALIPFIESGFNPHAKSRARALGTWQFMPGTAKQFGLDNNWWYDGRKDIIASTLAALTYLNQLNARFDGDWLLTMAAYNAGGGTVSNAIKRNRKQNKPTDYWSLKLPKETMHYVPRILALSLKIKNAESMGIKLADVTMQPYFSIVDTEGQLDLKQAAAMADVSIDIIRALNPAYERWATPPEGPHRLLLPASQAEQFSLALSQIPASERVKYSEYRIKSGDTLSTIAKRFETSVAALQQANRLRNTFIRAGQVLLIPSLPGELDLFEQLSDAS